MKKLFVLSFFTCILFSCQQQKEINWEEWINENMEFASEQYLRLNASVPDSLCPRTYEDGQLLTSGTDWWCSGFFPGSLWYLYEFTGREELKDIAHQRTMQLEKEKWNTGTHDLGFMLYCSFGNGYRITKDESYSEIMLQGAGSLLTRYNPATGCIKSWDHGKWQFPVIIDNMMNLEFLFWAADYSADSSINEKILSHADNTLKNHFRADYSSFHLVDYDSITGDVIAKQTVQGWADESSWARGQAWGLYGFTTVYRETGDVKYLEHAQQIADYILHHPNLPEDMIPYWDFNAPDIPDAKRDASAGAIIASALIELSGYSDEEKSEIYLDAAKNMLYALGNDYKAGSGENGNFILKHSVGHFTKNSEVDVPLSYADYYFIEALYRLSELI